jgi:hypothetical protein
MNDLRNLQMSVNASVVSQAFDSELMLFNLETDGIYQLNATGKQVWELVSAGWDMARIQDHFLNTYDVDADVLANELSTTITMLIDEKLVTVTNAN